MLYSEVVPTQLHTHFMPQSLALKMQQSRLYEGILFTVWCGVALTHRPTFLLLLLQLVLKVDCVQAAVYALVCGVAEQHLTPSWKPY